MTLDPAHGSAEESGRYVAPQRGLTALSAHLPRSVSAEETAADRARGKYPRISAMSNQPEQEQIGASGVEVKGSPRSR